MKLQIAKYQDLRNIKIREIGEDFVVLKTFCPGIKTGYFVRDMLSFFGGQIIVRRNVARKLATVNQNLKKINKKYTLGVVYGYRSLEVQKKYFNREFKKTKKTNQGAKKDLLIELTHKRIAVPEVAGHPTGGAVDLTIFNTEKEEFLDMGGEIADFSDNRLSVFSENLTSKQKDNRQILQNIMKEAGFCPFYEEWWHFSYGDKEWAWFYNKKFAIYSQIEISDIEGLLPDMIL